MSIQTRKLRGAVALVFVLGVLGGALIWSRSESEFTTPAECLAAYYEACQTGEVARYLRCLGEPLRSESRRRLDEAGEGAVTLRQQAVRNWVQDGEPESAGAVVRCNVDEVRITGVRRVQFRLERFGKGWLIVAITPREEKPPTIPYGTDVRTGSPGR